MAAKDQGKAVPNSATDFLQEILSFLGGPGGIAQDQLSFATDLQRNIGDSIQSLIGNQGNPFDVTPQAKALQEGFDIDNRRGAQTIQEQFGAAGSRFGTPIAVGTGRFLEGVLPRQEALIQDLFFRSHEGAQGRLLAGQQAGTQLASSSLNPFLQLAGLGREDTATKKGVVSTVGGFVDAVVPG